MLGRILRRLFCRRDWTIPRRPYRFQGRERWRPKRTDTARPTDGWRSREHRHYTDDRDECPSQSKAGGRGAAEAEADTSQQSSKVRASGDSPSGHPWRSASGEDRARARREPRGRSFSHGFSFEQESGPSVGTGATGYGHASDCDLGLHASKPGQKKTTRARGRRAAGKSDSGGAIRRWHSWREVDVCVVEEESSGDEASQGRRDLDSRRSRQQGPERTRNRPPRGGKEEAWAATSQKPRDSEREKNPDRRNASTGGDAFVESHHRMHSGKHCKQGSASAQRQKTEGSKEGGILREQSKGQDEKMHAACVRLRESDEPTNSPEDSDCGEGGVEDREDIPGDERNCTHKQLRAQGIHKGKFGGSCARTDRKLTSLDATYFDSEREGSVPSLSSGSSRYVDDRLRCDAPLQSKCSTVRETHRSGRPDKQTRRKDREAVGEETVESRPPEKGVVGMRSSGPTSGSAAKADQRGGGRRAERTMEHEVPGRHFDVYSSLQRQHGSGHVKSTCPRRRGFFDSDSDEETDSAGDCPDTAGRQKDRGARREEGVCQGTPGRHTPGESFEKADSATETASDGGTTTRSRGPERQRGDDEATQEDKRRRGKKKAFGKEVDVYTLASALRTKGKPRAIPRMTYAPKENDNRVEGVLFLDERPIKNWYVVEEGAKGSSSASLAVSDHVYPSILPAAVQAGAEYSALDRLLSPSFGFLFFRQSPVHSVELGCSTVPACRTAPEAIRWKVLSSHEILLLFATFHCVCEGRGGRAQAASAYGLLVLCPGSARLPDVDYTVAKNATYKVGCQRDTDQSAGPGPVENAAAVMVACLLCRQAELLWRQGTCLRRLPGRSLSIQLGMAKKQAVGSSAKCSAFLGSTTAVNSHNWPREERSAGW